MNRKVFSWAFYDFANTIFSMNIVSRYFPMMAISILGATELAIGFSRSAAMILVALTMPVFGALADQHNKRKLPLLFFTLACCVITAFISSTGNLAIELALFCLAIYCFQSALVFYNALLPIVAPPGRVGYVSGLGVALGYAGSITGLFVVAILSSKFFSPYIWTAILFFLLSLPIFIWVKDRPIQKVGANGIKPSPYRKGLLISIRRARQVPGVARFLVGRFFVVEAMETVILFMAVFLVKSAAFNDAPSSLSGFDEVTLYLMVVTFFTIIGSYLWGILTQMFGPRRMLIAAIFLWLAALSGFVFTSSKPLFYLWGSLAGTALGGVWTSDRPLLINLVGDADKLGEFFGLYALTGRLAAVIGPLIWGLVIYFGQPLGDLKYKFAIEALFLMMVLGLIILRKLPDAR